MFEIKKRPQLSTFFPESPHRGEKRGGLDNAEIEQSKIKMIYPKVLLWWIWVRQINAESKKKKYQQPNKYNSNLLPCIKG